MIRARLTNGTFVLGVDAENIRRLTDGQPFLIDLGPLGGSDKFMMIYGITAQDIMAELRAATGQLLPPLTDLKEP